MNAIPITDEPPDDGAPPFDYTDEPRGYGRRSQKPSTLSAAEPSFIVHRLDQVTLQPRRSIVQGLGLDDGCVATIGGAPNTGKTAFSISLMLAVASRAERWLNLKVAGGPVVYFAPEAPASVKMRARAALARMAVDKTPAFYICEDVPSIGGELTSEIHAARIIATIQEVQSAEGERVCLAALDTLAGCMGDGDENGAGMLLAVAAAKKVAAVTGVCVVLIHHPSKGDGAGLRGHGSLAAACDSIIRIEADELTGVRTATLTKARDHATGLQLRFELEPVTLLERDSFGDPYTTVIVRSSDKPAPRPRPGGRQQETLLAELERRYRTGERQWDEAAVRKAGRTLDMPRNSPIGALKGLIKAGYLVGTPGNLSLKFPPEVTP